LSYDLISDHPIFTLLTESSEKGQNGFSDEFEFIKEGYKNNEFVDSLFLAIEIH